MDNWMTSWLLRGHSQIVLNQPFEMIQHLIQKCVKGVRVKSLQFPTVNAQQLQPYTVDERWAQLATAVKC